MNTNDYIDEVEITEEIPVIHQLEITIPATWRGERLDKALAANLEDYSRSKLQHWIELGLVHYGDGRVAQVKDQVLGEQVMLVDIPEEPQNKAFTPEDIPLEIIYSDASIALINKPAGMVVHPAAGNWSGTLLNALLYRFPECNHVPRAGIVHRLDKDTSGLLVVAKNIIVQNDLVKQLQARTVSRRYLALVWGTPPIEKTISASIGRDPRDRLKMAISDAATAKEAITNIKVLQTVQFNGKAISLVECKLQTGRTHQIRVHLQYLGFPLVNDPIYQQKTPLQLQKLLMSSFSEHSNQLIPGQVLHATQLGLIHPQSGELFTWYGAPSPAFLSLLAFLGIQENSWLHLKH